MEKKFGFLKMNVDEFRNWIRSETINRSVLFLQQHHTYRPDYSSFKGNNHFELQRNMKHHHVVNNGWSDIGQHFSIFPDGMILTGRNLEKTPACIKGKNAHSVCIENVGNFDVGGDVMTEVQKNAIIEITAALCFKFEIQPDLNSVLYHHWFNLSTGERNNGAGGNKSCPGSDFFGGNKVEDFVRNFLPRIQNAMETDSEELVIDDFDKLVCVTANRLNVRTGPGTNNRLATGIAPLDFGMVIKTFREQGGWYKVNAIAENWISGRYTRDVFKGEVTANVLNVRSGPGTNYAVVDQFRKGQNLIIEKEKKGWYKLNFEDKWVSKPYVDLV